MPKQRPRGVLLDSGGVLLLPDPEAMRAAVRDLGLRPDDETCWKAHYAGMHEIDRSGLFDWSLADHAVARVLGVPEDRLTDSSSEITQVYTGTDWLPVAGAAEALQSLQRAGYALAIVSNASGNMEEQLATHQVCSTAGGACVQVDIVVDSTVVGVEKPDPKIFALALDAVGLPPEECVYVGDSVYFDVNGARAAGIEPIHVDPFRFCTAADHPHVASVVEIEALLAARQP